MLRGSDGSGVVCTTSASLYARLRRGRHVTKHEVDVAVCCRTVETEDQLHAGIIEQLKNLADIGSDVRRILSLTISVREADVSDTEIELCKQVLTLMSQLGVAEDVIMTTERGDAEDHLHMQAMLHGPFKMRKGQSAAMKDILVKSKCFDRSFAVMVKIHKLTADVTWKSMAGCGFVSCHLMSTVPDTELVTLIHCW
jgi:hypothetical protein